MAFDKKGFPNFDNPNGNIKQPIEKTASSVKPFTQSAYDKFQLEKTELVKSRKNSSKTNKTPITILTCGHVDAGKSTMLGNLIKLLGFLSKAEIHKLKKLATEHNKPEIDFSWVLDSIPSERAHGITVNVGTKYFETERRAILALDCPGHKDFVPNMLSETSSADVAMLVVDTSTDNFERGFCKDGQTREHSILARSLGISKILVAMNKMDSTKWSKTRFDQIEKTLDHFLKSIGYKSTLFVPISGLEGHNLVRSYTECDWYTGPTLKDAINSIKPVTRDLSRPVRLLVSGREHSFKYGNVVLGKIAVGSLMVGEKLVAMPLNMAVQVKSIRCGEKEVVVGIAGENVEAAFGKETTLETGFVVCDQMNPIPVVKVFSAKITTLKLDLPIIRGQTLLLHVHNIKTMVSVVKIEKVLNSKNAKKPKCLVSNVKAIVRFRCEKAICVETADQNRFLSRFVLRRKGITVAIGVIEHLVE